MNQRVEQRPQHQVEVPVLGVDGKLPVQTRPGYHLKGTRNRVFMRNTGKAEVVLTVLDSKEKSLRCCCIYE